MTTPRIWPSNLNNELREKIVKLDKRYAGNEVFKYRLAISGPRPLRNVKFKELRAWCWESWGPSCELELFTDFYYDSDNPEDRLYNKYWAWNIDLTGSIYYIYFTDDAALAYYKLKWW